MKFLDEKQARNAIREMMATASEAKIAVAFWGSGAAADLELLNPNLKLEIVCNLASGACNPAEIEKLRAQIGDNLLNNPRLHGKVYWTPTQAVIGSSNASTNGLAIEGAANKGWAEANVLVREPSILEELGSWIASCREGMLPISDEDLNAAKDLWKRRARLAPVTLERDLFVAYRASPDHPRWKQVKFAFVTTDLSEEGEKEYDEHRKDAAFLNYEAYEDWKDAIRGGDRLVAFQLKKRRRSFEFDSYYASPDRALETASLTWMSIEDDIDLAPFPRLTISERDIKALARAMTKKLERARTRKAWMLSISEAAKLLE